jgi:aminopeptidase N
MQRAGTSVRSRALVAAVALSLVGAVLVLAAPVLAGGRGAARAAQAAGFSAGSAGVGDPYFPHEGNGGYDVAHYGLRLSYDPATHHLAGSGTITAVARKSLSRFDLDLTGFKVSEVTVGGRPARFRRSGQELVITPARGLTRGSRFTTVVSYAGVPRTVTKSRVGFGDYGWIYTRDGAFVGSEPNAAHTWYPSNDHPRDKATFRFRITVPTGRKVVANGTYRGHRVHGRSDTYVWDERTPMATYLATLGIGRWDFHRGRTPRGIESFTAVDPALAKQAARRHTAARTARITDYWSRRFGRYPFGSTGAIVDNLPRVGFSLETQTRPLYGFVPDPVTMSHELSHEWFGDSVSVRTWRHIWLNEGFATFGSWLWAEHTGGPSTLRQARMLYGALGRKDSFWRTSVADPKRDRMFSSPVYYRGGMALAALRHKIGDRDFFTLLRTWVRTHRNGNVTTPQFRALAHRVSGKPMQHFFRVWLWDKRKPERL